MFLGSPPSYLNYESYLPASKLYEVVSSMQNHAKKFCILKDDDQALSEANVIQYFERALVGPEPKEGNIYWPDFLKVGNECGEKKRAHQMLVLFKGNCRHPGS